MTARGCRYSGSSFAFYERELPGGFPAFDLLFAQARLSLLLTPVTRPGPLLSQG